jgi:hypothetical protein
MEESLSPNPALTPEPVPQDEKFWKEHIAAAQKFRGTAREYCRLNGLNQQKFREYRRLFGFTKRRGSGQTAFIKVETTPKLEPSTHKVIHKKENKLPDPNWVADLITHLMERL